MSANECVIKYVAVNLSSSGKGNYLNLEKSHATKKLGSGVMRSLIKETQNRIINTSLNDNMSSRAYIVGYARNIISKIKGAINEIEDQNIIAISVIFSALDNLISEKRLDFTIENDRKKVFKLLSGIRNYKKHIETSKNIALDVHNNLENVNDLDSISETIDDDIETQTDEDVVTNDDIDMYNISNIESEFGISWDTEEGQNAFRDSAPALLKNLLSNLVVIKPIKDPADANKILYYAYEYIDKRFDALSYINWTNTFEILLHLSQNIYKENSDITFEDIIKEIFEIIKNKKSSLYDDTLLQLVGYDYNETSKKFEKFKVKQSDDSYVEIPGLFTENFGYTVTIDSKNNVQIHKKKVSETIYGHETISMIMSTFGRPILTWANVSTYEIDGTNRSNVLLTNRRNIEKSYRDEVFNNFRMGNYVTVTDKDVYYNIPSIIRLLNEFNNLYETVDNSNNVIINSEEKAKKETSSHKQVVNVNKAFNLLEKIGFVITPEAKESVRLSLNNQRFINIKDGNKNITYYTGIIKDLIEHFEAIIEDYNTNNLPLIVSNVNFFTDIPSIRRFIGALNLTVFDKRRVLDFLSKSNKKLYAGVNSNHIFKTLQNLLGISVVQWTEKKLNTLKRNLKKVIDGDSRYELQFTPLLQKLYKTLNDNNLTLTDKLQLLTEFQYVIYDSFLLNENVNLHETSFINDRIISFLNGYQYEFSIGAGAEDVSRKSETLIYYTMHPTSVSKITRALREFKYFKLSEKVKKSVIINDEGFIDLKVDDRRTVLRSNLTDIDDLNMFISNVENGIISEELLNIHEFELNRILKFQKMIIDAIGNNSDVNAIITNYNNMYNDNERKKLKNGLSYVLFNYLNTTDVFIDVDDSHLSDIQKKVFKALNITKVLNFKKYPIINAVTQNFDGDDIVTTKDNLKNRIKFLVLQDILNEIKSISDVVENEILDDSNYDNFVMNNFEKFLTDIVKLRPNSLDSNSKQLSFIHQFQPLIEIDNIKYKATFNNMTLGSTSDVDTKINAILLNVMKKSLSTNSGSVSLNDMFSQLAKLVSVYKSDNSVTKEAFVKTHKIELNNIVMNYQGFKIVTTLNKFSTISQYEIQLAIHNFNQIFNQALSIELNTEIKKLRANGSDESIILAKELEALNLTTYNFGIIQHFNKQPFEIHVNNNATVDVKNTTLSDFLSDDYKFTVVLNNKPQLISLAQLRKEINEAPDSELTFLNAQYEAAKKIKFNKNNPFVKELQDIYKEYGAIKFTGNNAIVKELNDLYNSTSNNEFELAFYDKKEFKKNLIKYLIFEFTINNKISLTNQFQMFYGDPLTYAVYDKNGELIIDDMIANFYKRNTFGRSPSIPKNVLNYDNTNPVIRETNTFVNAYISDISGPSYELYKHIFIHESDRNVFMNLHNNDIILFDPNYIFKDENFQKIYEKVLSDYEQYIKNPNSTISINNLYTNLPEKMQDILSSKFEKKYIKDKNKFSILKSILKESEPYINLKHTDAADVCTFEFFLEKAKSAGYVSEELANKIIQMIHEKVKIAKDKLAANTLDDNISDLDYIIDDKLLKKLKKDIQENILLKHSGNPDGDASFNPNTIKQFELMDLAVLVLKDIYVGFIKNEKLGIDEMIFDKNATRVLIPNTIQYSKLDFLRKSMELKGIDRVSPPSAIKMMISAVSYPTVGYWQAPIHTAKDAINWFNIPGNVSMLTLNYNDYGEQTPQRESDKSIFASQVKSLIHLNQKDVKYETVYTNGKRASVSNYDGQQHYHKMQELWKELYRFQYDKFMQKVVDKSTGKVNHEKLIKYIIESLSHTKGVTDNDKNAFLSIQTILGAKYEDIVSDKKLIHTVNEILNGTNESEKRILSNFLRGNPNNTNNITESDLTKFAIPLFITPNSYKLQAILNSLVKTKLKSKGTKGVLVPDIQTSNEIDWDMYKGNMVFTNSSSWNGQTKLKDMRISEGKVLPAQIVLSWNFKANKRKFFNLNNHEYDITSFREFDDYIDENILTNSVISTRISNKYDTDDKVKAKVNAIFTNEELTNIRNFADTNGLSLNKLLIHKITKPDGNIQIYIEHVSISKELLDINDYLLKPGDNGYIDGKMILNTSLLPIEILRGFGNRIPTQEQSSMVFFEIVGFISGIERSMLIAPSDFLIRMGSDFDIDTLYSLLYNHTFDLNTGKLELEQYYNEDNAVELRFIKYIESKYLHRLSPNFDKQYFKNIVVKLPDMAKINHDTILKIANIFKIYKDDLPNEFIQKVSKLINSNIPFSEFIKTILLELDTVDTKYDKSLFTKTKDNNKNITNIEKILTRLKNDNPDLNLDNLGEILSKESFMSSETLSDDTIAQKRINNKKIYIRYINNYQRLLSAYLKHAAYLFDTKSNDFQSFYDKISQFFTEDALFDKLGANAVDYTFKFNALNKHVGKPTENFLLKDLIKNEISNVSKIRDKYKKRLQIQAKNIEKNSLEYRKSRANFIANKLGIHLSDFASKSIGFQNGLTALENKIKDGFITVLIQPSNLKSTLASLDFGLFFDSGSPTFGKKELKKLIDDINNTGDTKEKEDIIMNAFKKYSMAKIFEMFNYSKINKDPLNWMFNLQMYDSSRTSAIIIGAMALNQVGQSLIQLNDRNFTFDEKRSLVNNNTIIVKKADGGIIKSNRYTDSKLLDDGTGMGFAHKGKDGSTYISLGVDDQKNQVLGRINATSLNLNAYIGFLANGFKSHWGTLINNQPIVKDLNHNYLKLISKGEGRRIAFESSMRTLFDDYIEHYRKLDSDFDIKIEELRVTLERDLDIIEILQEFIDYVNDNLTITSLFTSMISNYESSNYNLLNNKDYIITQILSLYNYVIGYEQGEAFGDWYRKTNIDSSGPGAFYNSAVNTLTNISSLFKADYPFRGIGNVHGDNYFLKVIPYNESKFMEADNLVYGNFYYFIQDSINGNLDNYEAQNIMFVQFPDDMISMSDARDKNKRMNFIKKLALNINFNNEFDLPYQTNTDYYISPNFSIYEKVFLLQQLYRSNTKIYKLLQAILNSIDKYTNYDSNLRYDPTYFENIPSSLNNSADSYIQNGLQEFVKSLSDYHNNPRIDDNVLLIPKSFKYHAVTYSSMAIARTYAEFFPYNSPLYNTLKEALVRANDYMKFYESDNVSKLINKYITAYLATFKENINVVNRKEFSESFVKQFVKILQHKSAIYNISEDYGNLINSIQHFIDNGAYMLLYDKGLQGTVEESYKILESMFMDNTFVPNTTNYTFSNLAKDLFSYWVIMNGMQPSFRSFSSLIPTSIFAQTSINSFFRNINWNDGNSLRYDTRQLDIDAFAMQAMQHNASNHYSQGTIIHTSNVLRAKSLKSKTAATFVRTNKQSLQTWAFTSIINDETKLPILSNNFYVITGGKNTKNSIFIKLSYLFEQLLQDTLDKYTSVEFNTDVKDRLAILIDHNRTLLQNDFNIDDSTIDSFISLLKNPQTDISTIYIQIDNLGYNVQGSKVLEFGIIKNSPIGFSINSDNKAPLSTLLFNKFISYGINRQSNVETFKIFSETLDPVYIPKSTNLEILPDSDISFYKKLNNFTYAGKTFNNLNNVLLYGLFNSQKPINSQLEKLFTIDAYKTDTFKLIHDIFGIGAIPTTYDEQTKIINDAILNILNNTLTDEQVQKLQENNFIESRQSLNDFIKPILNNMSIYFLTTHPVMFDAALKSNPDLKSKLLSNSNKTFTVAPLNGVADNFTFINGNGQNIYGIILNKYITTLETLPVIVLTPQGNESLSNSNGEYFIHDGKLNLQENEPFYITSLPIVQKSSDLIKEDTNNNVIYITYNDSISNDQENVVKITLNDEGTKLINTINNLQNSLENEPDIDKKQSILNDINSSKRKLEIEIHKIFGINLSKTPTLDKLPNVSSIPTFTYAGIGSRETPPSILQQMTEFAKELDDLGYILHTGFTFKNKETGLDEEGADKAFSDGSKNKILFGPDSIRITVNGDTTKSNYDKTISNIVNQIVDEIHPNPSALKSGGRKLMGRNTNQIFGQNLDNAVDFVLFYAEETSNPLRPKGGTGQAVEIARRKGIPTINIWKNPNWKQQVMEIINKIQENNKTKMDTVTYNEEQQNAINVTSNFINNRRINKKNTFALIEGKAGTGKTFTVPGIIRRLTDRGLKIGVAALSNQAKDVISNKLKEEGINAEANSIAGLLGKKKNDITGVFETPKQIPGRKIIPPPIKTLDVIFIDEASMIDEYTLEEIFREKPANTAIIFLGDIGQLGPIRSIENPYYSKHPEYLNQKSPLFNPDSPFWKKSSITYNLEYVSKLITRVRQGEDSPILPFADYYWSYSQNSNNNIGIGSLKSDITLGHDRKNILIGKNALLFNNSRDKVLNSVLPLYKKAINDKNPNLVKWVSYHNYRRKEINNFIHNWLFGNNSPQYNIGELVIFNSSYKIDEYTFIDNSQQGYIKSVSEQQTTDHGFKYYKVEIVLADGIYTVDVLDRDEYDKHAAYVSKLFDHAKALRSNGDRSYGAAFATAWYEKDERFANVDYSYAITSHKSQGSTYDVVIVDEMDINSNGQTSKAAKAESIYTGLTRPRHIAIMLSSLGINHNETLPDIFKLLYGEIEQNNRNFNENIYGDDKELTLEDKLLELFNNDSNEVNKFLDLNTNQQIEKLESRIETLELSDAYSNNIKGNPEIKSIYKIIQELQKNLDIKSVIENRLKFLFKSNFSTIRLYNSDDQIQELINLIDTYTPTDDEEEFVLDTIYMIRHQYDDVPPINIYSTDKNGFEKLSNILNGPITTTINDKEYTFKTVEHLYQAKKAAFAGDTETANAIYMANTGWDAQRLGSKNGPIKWTKHTPAEWDLISEQELESAMRLAFEQNEDARNLLLSTDKAALTHRAKKANLGKWEQTFPEILMKIRKELSDDQSQIVNVDDIYSQLGNKTQSENVVIKPWKSLKDAESPITEKGIISTRIKTTDYNFGNVFSHEFGGNLIKVDTIEEAVKRYINWILTGETGEYVFTGIQPEELESKREWILEKLKSGELKGKPILYYKELGEPSHATALDYLINEYDWNEKISTYKPNNNIETPSNGVELLTDSGLSVEKANKFIDILAPIIMKSAERENVSNDSNYMFSFGKRWTRLMAVRGYWKNKFDKLFNESAEFGRELAKSDKNIQKRMTVLNKYLGTQFNTQINPHNKGWSATGFNYGYDNLDAYGNPVENMKTIEPITKYIEAKLGIDLSDYDSVLANIYTPTQFIPPHRDTTEDSNAEGYAIVVINIGADGSISEIPNNWYQDKANQDWTKTKKLPIKNGGIYAFGVDGIDRFNFFHGINVADFGKTTPTKPITLPDGTILTEYRITLTYRRSTNPKDDNAPIKPRKLTAAERQIKLVESDKIANQSIIESQLEAITDKIKNLNIGDREIVLDYGIPEAVVKRHLRKKHPSKVYLVRSTVDSDGANKIYISKTPIKIINLDSIYNNKNLIDILNTEIVDDTLTIDDLLFDINEKAINKIKKLLQDDYELLNEIQDNGGVEYILNGKVTNFNSLKYATTEKDFKTLVARAYASLNNLDFELIETNVVSVNINQYTFKGLNTDPYIALNEFKTDIKKIIIYDSINIDENTILKFTNPNDNNKNISFRVVSRININDIFKIKLVSNKKLNNQIEFSIDTLSSLKTILDNSKDLPSSIFYLKISNSIISNPEAIKLLLTHDSDNVVVDSKIYNKLLEHVLLADTKLERIDSKKISRIKIFEVEYIDNNENQIVRKFKYFDRNVFLKVRELKAMGTEQQIETIKSLIKDDDTLANEVALKIGITQEYFNNLKCMINE